ncbi:MAG: M20/M25/M40 family metallo-hydrolase, partial [Parvularculaceae bacterium]|nr:M20/M25/M40 family metallo-hydrolase [Parvularculaceae bacterium]
AADVEVGAKGPAPTLVATYRGSTREAPILLLGHLDVVPADKRDWTHDPFTPIERDGFVVGRGAVDNKFDVSAMVATLLRLKAEGFAPKRDLILVLSGDEESAMASTAVLAERFKGAFIALNGDGGGGDLDDANAPVSYGLQAAAKTYAEVEIAAVDAGGHRSRPPPTNAIYRLARALDRVAAVEFPTQANDVTRAWFRATGAKVGGEKGAAMIRFADNPDDRKAVRLLKGDIDYANKMATTCVATMLSGGHAPNALPQRATATVNCRIFPGVDPSQVQATLEKAIGDSSVAVKRLDATLASDASPLREDVMAAVKKAVEAVAPGAPISPAMSAGATDSLYFRAKGVPSYGVSGLWMRPSDDFSHGLDERAPVAAFAPAMTHYHVLLTDIAGR